MARLCERVVNIEEQDCVLDRALVERGVNSSGSCHDGYGNGSLFLPVIRNNAQVPGRRYSSKSGKVAIVVLVSTAKKQWRRVANNLEGLLAGMADPHRSFAAGARGVGTGAALALAGRLDPELTDGPGPTVPDRVQGYDASIRGQNPFGLLSRRPASSGWKAARVQKLLCHPSWHLEKLHV